MAFTTTLIFLLGLSLVLIVISVLIWRSKLPDNDKVLGIICLLSVYCVVSVLNEARRGTTLDDLKYNPIDFGK